MSTIKDTFFGNDDNKTIFVAIKPDVNDTTGNNIVIEEIGLDCNKRQSPLEFIKTNKPTSGGKKQKKSNKSKKSKKSSKKTRKARRK
jgi:hypothetical protein